MKFCWHDWIKFESATCNEHIRMLSFRHGTVYAYTFNSYNLGYAPLGCIKFSNMTCSKCNKMNLKLDRAIAKALAKAKVAAKEKENQENIEKRRHKAIEFALKNKDLLKKAKKR